MTERSKAERTLALWVLRYHNGQLDTACAACVSQHPTSSGFVVKDFVCARHLALQIAADCLLPVPKEA